MPLLRPIHLPLHVLPHAITVLGLGLYLTLFRRPPLLSSSSSSTTNAAELIVPRPTTARTADTISLLGIATTGLMLPYFLSSYMPVEENQWLHVSVPIRLAISAALAGTCLVKGRGGMSREGFWEFLGLAVVDGVGATVLGLQLGRFDGMVRGAERWL